MLNSSSLKPVTPKNTQKYIIDVFFPTEHDPCVSLPLLVQEKEGNLKNQKIEKPLLLKRSWVWGRLPGAKSYLF